MAGPERPNNLIPIPRWTLIVHGLQALFAIIVLGLDAYGIRWIAYNALIYSLVVCICTLGVCAYMLASQLFLHTLYNKFIAMGLHVWMIIFWIVDLGLVANLARLWASPRCTYSYYYGYYCSYGKRDLHNLYPREETTFKAYYGALAAGAFFAGAQFVLWVGSLIIIVLYMNKQKVTPAQPEAQPLQQPPPQYGANSSQAVHMEKYNQTGVGQQPYSGTPTPQPQYAQPILPPQGQYTQPPQPVYNQQQQQQQQYSASYPQDPVPRQNTVSPVSQVGYAPPSQNASELQTPQHAGYNPNVSELSTPQHTGEYNPNVSELSSLQHTGSYNPNVSELSAHK